MPNGKTSPTLEDVAKHAGVSTATVSRCLNTPERVVERTRKKVLNAVEALGYTPNFGARAMAARRTFTIGAVIPTMDNAIFAKGLQAIQQELHNRGYTLLVSCTGYAPEVEAEQIKNLVSRGADGLLLIGYEREAALYKYLEQQKVPALVTWAYAKDGALPSVGFDNKALMSALTQKVLDLGHKKIGVISGVTHGNDRSSQRLAGVKAALSDAPTADLIEVIEMPYSIENGAKAFHSLMHSPQKPTVVICGNDVLAVGALGQAQRLGLRVPDDVSITGFDDIELAQVAVPPLTTVHLPHQEMGRRAAAELVAMVEGKSQGQSHQLACQIITRQSLAAPPT